MRTFLSVSALSLALTPVLSHAFLEATIVSGARTEESSLVTPATVQVIDREQIEQSGAQQVTDILRGQGSIYVADSFGDGSRASVSMRGFSSDAAASNTLVLIDGRRVNNTDISPIDFNSIAVNDIERIEIVQGSAGVLFGDQAVGGVINIITRSVEGSSAVLEAGAGTYSTSSLRASITEQLSDDWGLRFSAEQRQSDNYRRQNNDIDYSNLFAKAQHTYTGGSSFIELQHIVEDLGTPGSLLASEVAVDRRQTFVDFLDDFTDSTTTLVRAGNRHNIDANWTLQTELAARDVERDVQQSFRGLVVTSPDRLERKQVDLTPRLVGRFPGAQGEYRVTAGVDILNTEFSNDNAFAASTDDQRMLSFYAQSVVPLQSDTSLTIGVRHAEVEDEVTSGVVNGTRETDATAVELGLVRKLGGSSRVSLRVDQNFRFPKVDELTYVSDGETLEPQTGQSIELGWQGRVLTADMRVSAYRLDLEDEIAFDPTAPTPTGGFFAGSNVNFGETRHQGVILEFAQQLATDITLSANYSYTEATFENGADAGNSISGVPENIARLGFNHRLSEALSYQLDAVYTGSRYLDGDNANAQAKLSGHTVIDMNLRYERKDWYAGLRISNLTDRLYVENANAFGSLFPMPERRLLLTAGWKL